MAPALDALVSDLQAIFANRLRAVVLYGPHAVGPAPPGRTIHTLGVVADLSLGDLEACARKVRAWRRDGLAVPLLLVAGEIRRSLDAFPAEFGAILAAYRVVHGADPFDGLSVDPADLRRACEVEARGYLLHLREGFIESAAEPEAITRLVEASAPALRTLLVNLAWLDGSPEATPSAYATSQLGPHHGRTLAAVLSGVDGPAPAVNPAHGFEAYLSAAEALVAYVDRWAP